MSFSFALQEYILVMDVFLGLGVFHLFLEFNNTGGFSEWARGRISTSIVQAPIISIVISLILPVLLHYVILG